MIICLTIALFTTFAIFSLFLVISKTINGVINQLMKIEYCITKELEYRREEFHVRLILEEAEIAHAKMREEVLTGKKRR